MDKDDALAKIYEHIWMLADYKVLDDGLAETLYTYIKEIVEQIDSLNWTSNNPPKSIEDISGIADIWDQIRKARIEDWENPGEYKDDGDTPR